MNIFKKIKAAIRYKKAVRMADEAHAQTGFRYFVMPLDNKKKTLIVMDRDNFRKLKRKKYISRKATMLDLEKESFYHTSYANGTGELSKAGIRLKKLQYLRWYCQ